MVQPSENEAPGPRTEPYAQQMADIRRENEELQQRLARVERLLRPQSRGSRRRHDSGDGRGEDIRDDRRKDRREEGRDGRRDNRREERPQTVTPEIVEGGEQQSHPLVERILHALPPRHYISQALPQYDGSKDPKKHVEKFNTLMMVAGAQDPYTVRVFCGTLEGKAEEWLNSLPPGSVTSTADLQRKLIRHFASSKHQPGSSQRLRTILQMKDEPLRDYIARYVEEARRVEKVDDKVHIYLLTGGIRAGTPFALSLAKNPPATYQELVGRHWEYVRMEELDNAKCDLGNNENNTIAHRSKGRSRSRSSEREHRGRHGQQGHNKPGEAYIR